MRDVKEKNRRIFDSCTHAYLGRELFRPEQRFLQLLRGRWADADVLDLGVGAGRTAYTFSAIARSYVGVDFSPRMIEMSRATIGESDRVKFILGDCCDLSFLNGRQFDVVIFSFNGIDCVGHDDRLSILAEIKKLVRAETGCFFFSSHNLHMYPFPLTLPPFRVSRALRSLYHVSRASAQHVLLKFLNRHVNTTVAFRRGWEILRDGAHSVELRLCYITPECQVAQLKELGFEVITIYDLEGNSIDPAKPPKDWWFHYLCRLKD